MWSLASFDFSTQKLLMALKISISSGRNNYGFFLTKRITYHCCNYIFFFIFYLCQQKTYFSLQLSLLLLYLFLPVAFRKGFLPELPHIFINLFQIILVKSIEVTELDKNVFELCIVLQIRSLE